MTKKELRTRLEQEVEYIRASGQEELADSCQEYLDTRFELQATIHPLDFYNSWINRMIIYSS